jgi:integrase
VLETEASDEVRFSPGRPDRKGPPVPVLTTASVAKYRPQPTRREIPDARARGLHLVIQPSGRKSWALRLRRPDGRTAKLTLGPVDLSETETSDAAVVGGALTLGQARELAAQIDRQRARGIDVVAEHKAAEQRQQTATADRAANSFAACVREFFAEHRTSHKRGAQRPRRWPENAAILGLRWSPGSDPATVEPDIIPGGLAQVWADKPVTEIDSHLVHTAVDEARKSGGENRARKLHATLSTLFGWLQKKKRRIVINPVTGVWCPNPPPSRERILSADEIKVFWKATERMGPAGAMYRLLLLVGARLREIAHMEHAELGDDGALIIPGKRTKNYKPLTLPLPKLALDIIASTPRTSDRYVFSLNGRQPISGYSGLKKELDAHMAEIAGKPVQPWRVHDLRRTFASNLAALGVALPVVEKLLNHVSGSFAGIVSVYQRFEFADEKADALHRWAQHLQGLVSGKPDNVTEFARERKRS